MPLCCSIVFFNLLPFVLFVELSREFLSANRASRRLLCWASVGQKRVYCVTLPGNVSLILHLVAWSCLISELERVRPQIVHKQDYFWGQDRDFKQHFRCCRILTANLNVSKTISRTRFNYKIL